jgi:hypothetical protein
MPADDSSQPETPRSLWSGDLQTVDGSADRIISRVAVVGCRSIAASSRARNGFAPIRVNVPWAISAAVAAPVALGSTPVIGKTFTVSATGLLVMNGVSHPVTASLTARDDGNSLAVVGSIPILFSDWGIVAPWGLEDHAAIKFLLILARSGQ